MLHDDGERVSWNIALLKVLSRVYDVIVLWTLNKESKLFLRTAKKYESCFFWKMLELNPDLDVLYFHKISS